MWLIEDKYPPKAPYPQITIYPLDPIATPRPKKSTKNYFVCLFVEFFGLDDP
jgi:hypothetical protein